jgi:riboflavin synthase alpha subunit
MFTGIVQDVGRIQQREVHAGDMRLTIAVDRLNLARVALGDSICVQGVCLTVTALTSTVLPRTCRARRSRSPPWASLNTWPP